MMDVTAALFPNMASFGGFSRFITSRCIVTRKPPPGRDLYHLFLSHDLRNDNLSVNNQGSSVTGLSNRLASLRTGTAVSYSMLPRQRSDYIHLSIHIPLSYPQETLFC